jgi:beta-lactamase regulating signal transducer with metallopeptidase domain
MTSVINLRAVAQFSAERMLNCLGEGLAIALFAWLLLGIMGLRKSGHQNSGTRFAVWFVALFAIAALPFAGALTLGSANAVAATGDSHSAITVPGSWAIYAFLAWALFALLGLFRVAIGLWQVRQVRSHCVAIDPASLDPALRVTLGEFRSLRPVQVCVSDLVQVPTAIGFIKPLVVLPAWSLRELSASELNAILLHELAHLRRWDDWTNLAQKLLRAVFFFHPAVWWIEGKLSLEREMACDDAVLAETANPRAYARCLVSVAEKSLVRRGLAMAQAAVSRVRQTSQRVAQILDVNRSNATRIWKPALGMVAAFAMVCVGLLPRRPELVSFHDPAATRAPVSAATSPRAPRAASAQAASPQAESPQAESRFAPAALHPRSGALPAGGLSLSAHRSSAIAVRTSAPRGGTGAQSIDPIEAKQKLPAPGDGLVAVNFTGRNQTAGDKTSTNQRQLTSVVLVYQGLQYDDAGFAHWTICVWRVRVPSGRQAIAADPAKST